MNDMEAEQQDEFSSVFAGEILAEEFLAGYDLTQAQLARALGILPNRIAEIVDNRRRISADTSLRLAASLSTPHPSSG
jgi:antitoxin HigA-1